MLPLVGDRVLEEFQRQRNILISGDVTHDMAMRVMLLIRDMDDGATPIRLIIDSPGGDVQAGWTIVDSMRLSRSPVHTVCYGEVSSIAALIFACGRRGSRMMLEHSRLMIHEPWGRLGPSAMKESDLRVASESMTETREEIERELSAVSGLPLEEVHRLCSDDMPMTAEEAVRKGFADSIIH